MKTRLRCPCGDLIVGTDEDDLVEHANAHLAANHPDHDYTREEILLFAY
ncbi:DUF1059 domain-containing protein [Nocardia sp. NPDC050413]